MNQRRPHATGALTVAATILACLFVTAAYTVPGEGDPMAAPAVEDVEDTEPAEPSSAATEERQFEHEYEPEPEPTDPPGAVEPDAAPAPAPQAAPALAPQQERDVEHEYEPERAPAPEAPQDSPPAPPSGDAADLPAPAEPAEEAEPAEHPVAVAGSPAPHPGPQPAADQPPGEPGAPAVEPDGAGRATRPGRTSVSARAGAPSGSMTALRSSTMDPFDDGVLAPLVAPRELARADAGPRRATAVTPADRELLASAGPSVAAPAPVFAGPSAGSGGGSTGAPRATVVLASVLLTLVATATGSAYVLQRRRAG